MDTTLGWMSLASERDNRKDAATLLALDMKASWNKVRGSLFQGLDEKDGSGPRGFGCSDMLSVGRADQPPKSKGSTPGPGNPARVPAVYLSSAFLAFLAVSATCRINKLRAFNVTRGFDSPRLHHSNLFILHILACGPRGKASTQPA